MARHTPVELPEGYVEFFKSLENWQNEESIRLKKAFNFEKKDLLRLLNANRKPLFDQGKIEINPSVFKDSYHRLLLFLKESRPDIEAKIEIMLQALDNLHFAALIQGAQIDAARAVETAENNGFPLELFVFTLDHALRPFLRVASEPYQEDLRDDRFYWPFPNICPLCGSKSNFSRLQSEDGQRIMFCEHCFSEWKVQYLACVYCGHDTPGDINYLKVDNDESYRVYVCEKCKGYLKTYDERSAGMTTDLFIANIETVYLDMLAQDRGYTTHDN